MSKNGSSAPKAEAKHGSSSRGQLSKTFKQKVDLDFAVSGPRQTVVWETP